MDKPAEIKILVTDLDGVLTDGRLTIDHNGTKMFKHFHSRDVRAIRELISEGWCVYIVSADDHGSGASFAEKVGALFMHARDKSLLTFVGGYYCIGDDAWDVPILSKALYSFCPRDADKSVMRLPGIIKLDCYGGRGVIAEFVHWLHTPTIAVKHTFQFPE